LNSLYNKATTNPDELRQRATKFVQLEEHQEFYNQVRSNNLIERKNDNFMNANLCPHLTFNLGFLIGFCV